jgi:hypothetical protein
MPLGDGLLPAWCSMAWDDFSCRVPGGRAGSSWMRRTGWAVVPAGSMFAFLAAHRAEVFPDADYADLFALPGVGRAVDPGHADSRGDDPAGAA